MTKQSILLLLLFLSTVLYSYSQKSFRPGYVILYSGDTIRGNIDYGGREVNPRQIAFSHNVNGNKVTLTPLDIKKFAVANEVYESGVVKLDKSPVSVENLKSGSQLQLETDTIFLQTLISGTKSLFLYKDMAAIDHFFISKDTSFEWLVYKMYFEDDNSSSVGHNMEFIQQLKAYLAGCPQIQKIESAAYSLNGITSLFKQYYSCMHTAAAFQKNEKMHLKAGVVGGMSLSSLSFGGASANYLSKAHFSTSAQPSGGIYLTIPQIAKKLALSNEIIYSSYSISGTYNDFQNENIYNNYTLFFKYSYLKLNTILRYTIVPVGNVTIGMGMSNGMAISKKNGVTEDRKFYATTGSRSFAPFASDKSYEFGLLGELRAQLNKVSAALRYEKSDGMSEAEGLKSSVQRVFFLVGLQF